MTLKTTIMSSSSSSSTNNITIITDVITIITTVITIIIIVIITIITKPVTRKAHKRLALSRRPRRCQDTTPPRRTPCASNSLGLRVREV